MFCVMIKESEKSYNLEISNIYVIDYWNLEFLDCAGPV